MFCTCIDQFQCMKCPNTAERDLVFWVSVSLNYLNSQWVHLHTHTNVFACKSTHTHIHTHTHNCLYMCTLTYIHIHTHTDTQIALNKCPSSGGRLPWRLIQVRMMWAGHLLAPPPLVPTDLCTDTQAAGFTCRKQKETKRRFWCFLC